MGKYKTEMIRCNRQSPAFRGVPIASDGKRLGTRKAPNEPVMDENQYGKGRGKQEIEGGVVCACGIRSIAI